MGGTQKLIVDLTCEGLEPRAGGLCKTTNHEYANNTTTIMMMIDEL